MSTALSRSVFGERVGICTFRRHRRPRLARRRRQLAASSNANEEDDEAVRELDGTRPWRGLRARWRRLCAARASDCAQSLTPPPQHRFARRRRLSTATRSSLHQAYKRSSFFFRTVLAERILYPTASGINTALIDAGSVLVFQLCKAFVNGVILASHRDCLNLRS